jgi:hypothetical protein
MSSDRGYGYSEGLTPEEIERLSRFLREIMEDGEEESLSSSTSSESSSSSF